MIQRKQLIIANWKSHGSAATITAWCQEVRARLRPRPDVELAICPPFIYLPLVRQLLGEMLATNPTISIAAQNLSPYPAGAYTGEIQAAMLQEAGCRYVLVGHSERRSLFGETAAMLSAKLEQALQHGLTPVFCLGETQEERRSNQITVIINKQLESVTPFFDDPKQDKLYPLIAYEPVWAIGTGLAARPEQAESMHQTIRQAVGYPPVRILYGGSVKADNAAAFAAQTHIDGLLVGGASLDAKQIVHIYTNLNQSN